MLTALKICPDDTRHTSIIRFSFLIGRMMLCWNGGWTISITARAADSTRCRLLPYRISRALIHEPRTNHSLPHLLIASPCAFFDLGEQPLANSLLNAPDEKE